ncbi:hypothetical protein CD790_18095 [Streptomyces sp. SAJ15]|nr:hypothetical protein CD790_18095 [Streptomyces sp. SAJ15]
MAMSTATRPEECFRPRRDSSASRLRLSGPNHSLPPMSAGARTRPPTVSRSRSHHIRSFPDRTTTSRPSADIANPFLFSKGYWSRPVTLGSSCTRPMIRSASGRTSNQPALPPSQTKATRPPSADTMA